MGRSLLSVSIVAGPSAPELLDRLAATESKIRLGLLGCSRKGQSRFVEELVLPLADDHLPEQIIAQITAVAERGAVDHLLIECDPSTPVMALASLFVPRPESAHSLEKVSRLTSTILAITPTHLLDAFIHRRSTSDSFSPCFIAEQLEFANVVFLEGAQNDPAFGLAREIVGSLNPNARVSGPSPSDLEQLLGATNTSFDFAAALEGAGWRALIESDHADQRQGQVRAFAYHARKPFHPEKFWNLLQEGLAGVFRAKGFFWLATRNDFVGGLNLAGAEFHHAAAGKWWATQDDHAREFHMPARTRKEWKEPFGDRRQALAFMGVELDLDKLRTQLDACLLSDSEAAAGAEHWHGLADPFPSWSSHHQHHHDHECDHEHESGDHDCCDH